MRAFSQYHQTLKQPTTEMVEMRVLSTTPALLEYFLCYDNDDDDDDDDDDDAFYTRSAGVDDDILCCRIYIGIQNH